MHQQNKLRAVIIINCITCKSGVVTLRLAVGLFNGSKIIYQLHNKVIPSSLVKRKQQHDHQHVADAHVKTIL